ncbi:MAG: hypothetical protein ACREB6_12210 [Rhodospirillales bacterium]
MTGEDDTITVQYIEELFREYEEKQKLKKIRRERPWAADIIRVLWPHDSGLHMNILEQEVWKLRKGN